MLSATKFVVAGAIAALFGGLLLAGVLTQPSDEPVPAVGASVSPEPTASYVLTRVPLDRSLSPFDSVATADGLWIPRLENVDSDDPFFRDVVHIDQGSGVQTTLQGLPEEGFDRLVPADDAVWAIGSQAVHRIDGASLAVTDSVALSSVPDEPGWPVVAHGSLWLTSSRGRPSSLVEIDLTTRSLRGEYEADDVWWLDGHAPGLVAVDDAIWVHSFAGREGQRLTRFDLERRAFTDRVDVPGVGSWDCCVAVDDAIWLLEQTGTLRRFDLETLEVTDTLRLDNGGGRQIIGGLAADGAIWVAAADVNRIDPETRAVTDVIDVGPREKPAFLHGGIWVANHLGGKGVSRIDPETRQVTHTLEVPAKYLHTPLASSDVIWVYTEEGRLFRIDRAVTPRTDATAPPLEEQPDDSATIPDLLPGVDLVTEEVELGVYRVLSDGTGNDLTIHATVNGGDLAQVVAGQDGSVWVRDRPAARYLGDDVSQEWDGHDRLLRLGVAGTVDASGLHDYWPDISIAPDGTLWALGDEATNPETGTGEGQLFSLSDGEWTAHGVPEGVTVTGTETPADGSIWASLAVGTGEGCPGGDEEDVAAGGRLAVARLVDGEWVEESIEPALRVGDGGSLAVGPDGTAMLGTTYYNSCRDGAWVGIVDRSEEGWAPSFTANVETDAGRPGTGPVAIGSDGTVWAYQHDGWPEPWSPRLLRRTDGDWEILGDDGSVPLLIGTQTYGSSLTVAPDGRLWVALQGPWALDIHREFGKSIAATLDGLCAGALSYDGTSWTHHLAGACVSHVSAAPSGDVWVAVLDFDPAWFAGLAEEVLERAAGPASVPPGIYVITPEAVAAAE